MAEGTDTQFDPASVNVIQRLILEARKRPDFVSLLETSLQKANDIAKNGAPGVQKLDPALYAAVKWWPTSFTEYLEYLAWFYRWIPHQSDHPGWKDPGTENYREPYDRLCHFYWLIDQKVGTGGNVIVQDIPWFSDWLVEYAQAWGEFLDTPASFNEAILQSFIKDSPKYQVQDSMIGNPPRPNSPSGWLTFNQFFARELNPGLRPIVEPADNTYVACPADCTYKEKYPIASDSSIPGITVKGTHSYANVKELLKGSKYKDSFANGQFVHFFLAPYSYHRFHTPVAGTVEECYPVQGKVFLNVILGGEGGTPGQFNAPDGAGDGYEFNQARGVITIDTACSPYGDIGIVAVIPIGMCQVSGVNMTHETGKECLKGDEFGYFTFGGSDIIVLFQEKANAKIRTETNYHHYGSLIARCES